MPFARADDLPTDVLDLRQKYTTYLQGIESGHTGRLQTCQQDYSRELTQLLGQFEAGGQSEAAAAVRQEAERFARTGEIEVTDDFATPAELAEKQRAFASRLEQLSREKNASIVKALGKYDAMLADKQKKSESNVGAALAIKEERDRAAQDPVVTAAAFELAIAGDDTGAGSGAPSPAGEASDDAGAPGDAGAAPADTSTEATSSGTATAPDSTNAGDVAVALSNPKDVRIYQAGKRLPMADASGYKKMSLSRSENSPVASPVTVTALSLDKAETEREGEGDHYRRERILDRWSLRLQLRTSPAAGVVKSPLVTVEFFIKSAEPKGRVTPEVYSVKRVELEQLVPETTTIDFPPVETMMGRERMGLGAVWKQSGMQFYGVIISVFDQQRALIGQFVSVRGLAGEASTAPPERSLRERIEEARVNMETARQELNEARMLFFSNQRDEGHRNAFLEATQRFEAAQAQFQMLKQEKESR
ncbi:MAG: hypothetical protein K8T26_13000 [Lentisphaerae bacterium]|nr:hypothetical protein [Lentisphaerota bacterium]